MPSWLSSRSVRYRLPLIVLLASIGLATVAVVGALRAARSQQAVAQKALREYTTFAAWSYGQHLDALLTNLLRETLGAVNHGNDLHTNPRIPTARELAHYLPWDASCECHRTRSGPLPYTFFAFRIGDDSLDVGLNSHVDPAEGWEVDRPLPVPLAAGFAGAYSTDESRWLLDTLTKRIRGLGAPDHGYTLVVGDAGRAPMILAYTLMPTSWGDTMVYGARYSMRSLMAGLGSVLDDHGLLPESFTVGRRNRDVLAVRVRDRAGQLLFDSAPGVTSPLSSRLDLSPRSGLLSVDAVIRPEIAGSLVIGGLPGSRVPFLAGLLVLSAALAVLAVLQLRREGELARMRADFVSSVSHELRTPLAQIRLYTETLRLGRANTDEQREWSLGHIERETMRLSHLVDNVLRFSSLARGGALRTARIAIADEVRGIVAEFEPLARARQVRVVAESSGEWNVALRPDALRHILLNLLDNAVKYGPAGQTIAVTVDGDDSEVRIAVDDEGPGVPVREREAIWSAFTRGAAAQSRGGSGIGLTIVREIAAQHGGRCDLETPERGGARFVVRLPARRLGVHALADVRR